MVMFLAGNYPLLLGRLRFIWELVFRALEADCCEQESGPTVDDKHEWLARNEKSMGWRTPILPLLERLFPMDNQKEIENCFKPTWDTLNCYVHPSAILRDDLIEESGLLFRDAFDEKLANKALHYATEVFELVWLAVLWRFPKAKPRLLSDPNVFKKCPRVRAMLEKSQGPFP